METSAHTQIRHLPLHDKHAKLGAKFGQFGSWEVPLYYTKGIIEEHHQVRQKAGLFDISHMGEFYFSGADTLNQLQKLLPRNLSKLQMGQAQYMPLMNEQGGIIDDIIVYRFGPEEYWAIVNAGNVAADHDWIRRHLNSSAHFQDLSEEKGLLALQGPASADLLTQVIGDEFTALGYYRAAKWKSGFIARTGYTGEDGFEIMADPAALSRLWDDLLSHSDQVLAIGFGARDTLRLEAGMPLHGHDISLETTPLDAGLDWAIDFKLENFMGRQSLINQKNKGIEKRLIGFEMIDRGIPRQDYLIKKNGKTVGKVTSGTFAPTLKKNIGMGYVAQSEAKPDNEIEIIIRDQACKAKIVALPFYRRKK